MKLKLTKIVKLCLLLSLLVVPALLPSKAEAQTGKSSIYLSPSSGTFTVGQTFNISFFVNTGGASVNTVKLDVKFPANKLQIVNPTAGNSFITLWITQPQYSNTAGTVNLQGGLPSPGINTSAGLITTMVFRVRAPGTAVVSVQKSSRVLANDGEGTDLLTSFGSGYYDLSLPAPEGPLVTSTTHADQNSWYRNNNPVFDWSAENILPVESLQLVDKIDYSWDFDQDSSNIPDNTVDGTSTSTGYEDIESGIWYFHIKARTNNIWGKTTHYVVYIDSHPPASFNPKIELHTASPEVRALISFVTTDTHSGPDHYETKIESISDLDSGAAFFTEATSPWQSPVLEPGRYILTVRAYDKAGNYRDEELEFVVPSKFFSLLSLPITSLGAFTLMSWHLLLLLLLIILIIILSIKPLREKFLKFVKIGVKYLKRGFIFLRKKVKRLWKKLIHLIKNGRGESKDEVK